MKSIILFIAAAFMVVSLGLAQEKPAPQEKKPATTEVKAPAKTPEATQKETKKATKSKKSTKKASKKEKKAPEKKGA